jgi:transposase
MMRSASTTRISSKPTSASCPASAARARRSAGGAITKAGHSRTRWLLIQAAVSILRRRPPQAEDLRTWAVRIAARRGKQVAVVALARRLAGILYALLRDGSVFEPQRVRSPRRPAAAAAAPVGM